MARKAAAARPSRKASPARRPKRKPIRPSSSRSPIGDRYRLEGTYERLRRALLEAPNDGRLDRSLSYWVLPTDRRLPIAFLDRTVRDLLDQPLEALMQTPGVGEKKILGFFDLLRRLQKTHSPHTSFGMNSPVEEPQKRESRQGRIDRFDPSEVSEAVWTTWCDTVERVGLGREKLGRIAPTLRPLPTVIWEKRLEEYTDLSLAKIRQLKTHGEKRVNAILGVFHAAHEAVSTSVLHEQIDLVLVPRFVPQVTAWLVEANRNPHEVTAKELHAQVVKRLVTQIEKDLGESIAQLASERLPLRGKAPSIKQQAERLEVTRTRIYQLLEDCGRVLQVRWPEGRWLLAPLGGIPNETDPARSSLAQAMQNLFYPEEQAAQVIE